jgi:hypothetical protein
VVWRIVLLAVLIGGFAPSEVGDGDCSTNGRSLGLCVSGQVSGDAAVLTGTSSQPGGSTGGATGREPLCDAVEVTSLGQCRSGRIDHRAQPAVTLSDIAAFRPAPGIERMEPDGWVVAGLPANIYAIVGQQLVDGTLLGQPATVRFTPIRYHWDYGDGTSAVRTTRGGTWAALGLREFDATPTSHVYVVNGEYTIRLTIDFRAEYRFAGSGFLPIEGVINLRANDLHITVDGAKTVLVEHDCTADPSGPGC